MMTFKYNGVSSFIFVLLHGLLVLSMFSATCCCFACTFLCVSSLLIMMVISFEHTWLAYSISYFPHSGLYSRTVEREGFLFFNDLCLMIWLPLCMTSWLLNSHSIYPVLGKHIELLSFWVAIHPERKMDLNTCKTCSYRVCSHILSILALRVVYKASWIYYCLTSIFCICLKILSRYCIFMLPHCCQKQSMIPLLISFIACILKL